MVTRVPHVQIVLNSRGEFRFLREPGQLCDRVVTARKKTERTTDVKT